MPDSPPEHADVVKLYQLLNNAEQSQQIGRRVLKAVITDVLRSRLAGNDLEWLFPREWGKESSVIAVLQEILDNVTLTEEERRILNELEKEEGDRHSPSSGKD
jgi:hypothetical protein